MKKWIRGNYDQLSNIASAIISVCLSLVASYSYDILKGDESVPSNSYIICTLIIFVFAAIVGISFLSKKLKKDLFAVDLLNNNIQKAYLAIQDLSLESQSYLQEHDNKNLEGWVFQNIKLAVNKCYDFFSSSFVPSFKIFRISFIANEFLNSLLSISITSSNKSSIES